MPPREAWVKQKCASQGITLLYFPQEHTCVVKWTNLYSCVKHTLHRRKKSQKYKKTEEQEKHRKVKKKEKKLSYGVHPTCDTWRRWYAPLEALHQKGSEYVMLASCSRGKVSPAGHPLNSCSREEGAIIWWRCDNDTWVLYAWIWMTFHDALHTV